jgi:2-polyprenyl-6-methoxyphenol hydroxylase-like FAD-dependent oxidoreductase
VPWPERTVLLPNALEQRYRRASRMAGILPIGRRAAGETPLTAFFWSLKRDQVAFWQSAGVPAWKADVAQLWPEANAILDSVTDADQITYAQYGHFTLRTPYSDRLVHIGDAARATSPQLGQGANMALLDAFALARALNAGSELQGALRTYARTRYLHTRVFQWASATFTPFYQSDSGLLPLVRDWLAAPLSRLPIADVLLARLVSGMIASPLAHSQFTPLRMDPNAED